ncbi:uncharacterized protein LOC122502754 [Leptopilina heterotoma]|uniref:uncharacterized protein LOC122502754 n=1 Tax=Leptopilina heterotoma TaxID=63436 RepID=UPI001CA7DAA6|nr:uncharacterized protein LOC122502754 [Leptopilina heterotoma]
MQRVPSQISTTEILIIVDNQIENDSKIFNVSLYQNSNVNLISHSGSWTLSENFLKPRKFRKIKKYDELVHKKGVVNLEGRLLQAAAYYNPPLCYLNTTINETINGVEAEIFLADNDFEVDGVEMRIFELIAKRLNFRWSIRKPSGSYRYGRKINDTTWNGGMIGQIFRKEIDIAFSGIWLKHDHYSFANLSEPWYELAVDFLVPRPKPYSSFWAIIRPFTAEVWTLIIIIVIIQTTSTIIKAQMDPNVPRYYRNFIVTVTEVMGNLVGTGISETVPELRLQMFICQFIGFLLVTAYSTILAASLSNPEYEKRIDTAKQFVEANLTWGREGPTPIFSDFFDLNDTYFSQFPSRFEHEEGSAVRHKKILEGNYAILGRFVGSLFFPENNVTNTDLKNYRLMKENAGRFYSSFAVQPWLLEPVNMVMLWLREGGITLYHLKDVIRRRAVHSLREVLVEYDYVDEGVAIILNLTPLGGAFSLLIVGFCLSTFVFYLELRSVRGTKSVFSVLRVIHEKKSREENEI